MEELFGFLILLVVFGTPLVIGGWLGLTRGRARQQRRRDQQIETHMRLGMRDAEAQERIARKLRDERR